MIGETELFETLYQLNQSINSDRDFKSTSVTHLIQIGTSEQFRDLFLLNGRKYQIIKAVQFKNKTNKKLYTNTKPLIKLTMVLL